MIRLLHTADWHLGHRLHDLPRDREHQAFLDWLLEVLVRDRFDALVVAGDVFDTANPSAAAQAMYYGFLGKAVQVTIDDVEVISIVGTDEIEQYAQLLGTKMLASGSSPKKVITVRVTVDGGQPHEQAIDLSAGMFVHIYLEPTGLQVYNTRFLVHE